MTSRRALAAAVLIACGGITACSLLVSTNGLSDGDRPLDGSTTSGDANVVAEGGLTETGAPPDAAVDASPSCDPSKPFGALVQFPAPVSSSSNETAGFFSPDRLTLYVASNRAGSADLYAFHRGDLSSDWGAGDILDLNSPQADSDPWLSADQLTIYFDTSRSSAFAGRNIFKATRSSVGSPFTTPVVVDGVGSDDDELEPWLPPSGERLYFSSDRTVSYALYVSAKAGASFGAPTLVAGLDSPMDDQESPFLTADELTILFASDRDGTVGKRDVWIAKRPTPQSAFGPVTHVPELSTTADDYPTWLSDDGCRIVIESYVTGNAELFYAERPK